MSKTHEEVEELKQNWLGDPCYELEDAPGFEVYAKELFEFRMENERRWAATKEEQRKQTFEFKAEQILDELHLTVDTQVLAILQIEALVLLGGQVKRVGDILLNLTDRY